MVSSKPCTSLEGHLLARELSNTATVLAASVKSSTTATTASTTTSTGTTTATTTTAASTTATAVVGTGRAVVQADGTAVQVSTVEVSEGLASLVNGRELDVTETLGAARLRVGGKTDAHNVTAGTEHLVNGVLVGAEGQVTNEQSLAFGASLVTERASAGLGALAAVALVLVGGTTSSVVEVDLTTIKLGVLLGRIGLGGVDGVVVLDVSESKR